MPSLDNDLKVTITTAADTKGVTQTEEAINGLSTRTAAVMGIMAGAAQSLVNTGINFITSSVGDAAKRVDTLNNSNRTFENMGFSAGATKDMMHQLDMSIRGLPTTLSDAVTGVELLTGATNDISQSRKIFDALNDGIIGFGGSAAQVNGAVIQLSQAFSNGKVDAQTWNSLIQNGMGPALDALARKMGLTIGDFKNGLSNGTISVGQFQSALIDLDTKGGGGMSSLNKIAHDSTSGITTGMENAKTAVTRGIADIITAIGSKNISTAISDIGKGFETLAKSVAGALKTVISLIVEANKFYVEHRRVINDVINILVPFVAALSTLFIALKIWDAFNQLQIAFNIMRLVTLPSLIATIQATWAVLMANPIILVVALVAAAVVLIIMHWQQVKDFIGMVWANIRQWASDAANWIMGVWNGVASWFGGLWGRISGGFSNAYNGMISWARSCVDDVVSFFTGLPGRIGNVVSGITSKVANDVKGAFHNLHIPGFATGVTNFGGGMALVGENGPEYVNLPRGSSVYTNSQSQAMGGGSSSTITIQQLILPGVTDKASFIQALDQDILLGSRGLSANRGAF